MMETVMALKKKPSLKKPTGKSKTAQAKVEKAAVANAPRQKDEFGFMEGTDSSIAAHALVEGGFDRVSIYNTIRDRIEHNSTNGLTTRNGTDKNIPNLVATVVKQMRNRGYVVESSWRMVKSKTTETQAPEAVGASVKAKKRASEAPSLPTKKKSMKKRPALASK
jgi:hypothetical protein